MRLAVRFVSVLTVALLSVGVVCSSASAAGDSFAFSHARISARGALVKVTVTVTCSPATDQWGTLHSTVQGQVTMSDATRSGAITTATAFFRGVTCNDTPQVLHIATVPSPFAFRRGWGVITATASDSDMSGAISFTAPPQKIWFSVA
jgi:hypothetical protein